MVELLTERTRIALPDAEAAPIVLNYFLENREHLKATHPPVREDFYTLANFTKFLSLAREQADLGKQFVLFIFDPQDPNKIWGNIGLSQISRGPFQAAYLGYAAAQSAEGKGLMFEAIGRVIQFAFEELRLHRLMANHMPDNSRSASLLKRLGFVTEGLAKNYLFINGQWRDHVLTSLTNPDWQPLSEDRALFAREP